MLRSTSLLLSLFALLVLPLDTHAQDAPPSIVEGTLVGHDGTPLSTSHVHVLPYDNNRTRSVPVGTNKSFRTSLDTTGVVTLQFTGHNHKMEETTVLARPGDTIGVDVRLGTVSLKDSLSEVHVLGGFNDFSYRDGKIRMQKENGTYAATLPTPKDSVRYQILGARPKARLLSGTQEQRVVSDGDEYRSVFASAGDSTKITFTPDAIPQSDTKPRVQYRDTTSAAARYASFYEAVKNRRDMWMQKMKSAKSAPARQAVVDSFDWSPSRRRLETALNRDLTTEAKHAYLAGYFAYTNDPDSTYAQQALATLSPDSPLWSLGRGAVSTTLRATGQPEAYTDFAYNVLRLNPSDEVRAATLYHLLSRAARNENTERQKLLFSWMKSEFPDSPRAHIAQRFSPYRTIQPGTSVPSFKVSGLRDTTKTYTPASFEGKYVLLDFWATWCAPCIQELPTLRKAYKKYRDDSFTILSLSFDGSPETVRDFLQNHEMPWSHTVVEGGMNGPLANRFEIVGIPKPILVGPDGKIVATEDNLRGEELLKTLEEHLGSTAEKTEAN